MIPPWPSPYGGPSDELPYHLRPLHLLRADEPWIRSLYIDGPDPAVATHGRPPGPSVPTATGRPGGHHVADRTAAGRTRPGAGYQARPVRPTVLSATQDGDRDDTGLPADRTVRPAPAVLSAPGAAGVRGRHRAERPGTAPTAAVPGRAVLRWLEVWVPRLSGLALVFAASFVVGVVAALTFAAYGRR